MIKRTPDDLAMVLYDMRFDPEGHDQNDSYPVVNVEVMIDNIVHLFDVAEYYYDADSNMIIITTAPHVT